MPETIATIKQSMSFADIATVGQLSAQAIMGRLGTDENATTDFSENIGTVGTVQIQTSISPDGETLTLTVRGN